MTRPARRPLTAARRWLVLLTALAFVPLLGAPAHAADEADVRVTIDELTPTRLTDDSTVRMSGTVTNAGDQTWSDAQAYLVIPYTPFTTRQQVRDAIDAGSSYTGRRVVDLRSIDELGDIDPGDTVPFSIEVPYDALTISGFEGVYPIGMQLLATGEDGSRSSSAIARATTFIPLLTGDTPPVPGAVVWPFLLDRRKDAEGYVDADDLAGQMAPGGRLRHMLDQASALPDRAVTLVLDPALLLAADDLAEGRGLGDAALSPERSDAVAAFRDDLIALAQRVPTWTTSFARPDLTAIEGSPRAEAFLAAIDRATTAVLESAEVTGRRVSWPASGDVTADLLERLRAGGEEPVLMNRSDLPGWEPRHGALVVHETGSGTVPLLVDAGLDEGVPGERTTATLRQRLVSEAALGSLERAGDPGSRSDAIAVVDPSWDPGDPAATADLASAFSSDLLEPVTLDSQLAGERTEAAWEVPDEPDGTPLPAGQIASVAEIVANAATLTDLVVDSEAAEADLDRRISELLSLAWRGHPESGIATARTAARQSRAGLDALAIEGPPSVTLSSSQGSFPVTISNEAPYAVRVGVRLDTSNPALDVPDVEPVEVAAGERRTVTVSIDLMEQSSSVFTAQLITEDGTPINGTDAFNVRSSAVGLALWIVIGLAGAFVVFALGRRFLRPQKGNAKESDDD